MARWKTKGAAKGTPQTFHVLMARQLELRQLGACTMAAPYKMPQVKDERMMKLILMGYPWLILMVIIWLMMVNNNIWLVTMKIYYEWLMVTVKNG